MHCYVKAHWLDIEIAAVALCSMTGPKPSEQVSASAFAPRAQASSELTERAAAVYGAGASCAARRQKLALDAAGSQHEGNGYSAA